jgi:hypothetical protein
MGSQIDPILTPTASDRTRRQVDTRLMREGTIKVEVTAYIENQGGDRVFDGDSSDMPLFEGFFAAMYALVHAGSRYFRVRVEATEDGDINETVPSRFFKAKKGDLLLEIDLDDVELYLRVLAPWQLARLAQTVGPGVSRALDVEVWHRWPSLRRLYDHAVLQRRQQDEDFFLEYSDHLQAHR